jgi:hypothetical protein
MTSRRRRAAVLFTNDVAVRMELKKMNVWLEKSTGWVFAHTWDYMLLDRKL